MSRDFRDLASKKNKPAYFTGLKSKIGGRVHEDLIYLWWYSFLNVNLRLEVSE